MNRDNYSYRVTGYYGGSWDRTEWYGKFTQAKYVYESFADRNWSQLCIERSDGAKKPSPDADEWVTEEVDYK